MIRVQVDGSGERGGDDDGDREVMERVTTSGEGEGPGDGLGSGKGAGLGVRVMTHALRHGEELDWKGAGVRVLGKGWALVRCC